MTLNKNALEAFRDHTKLQKNFELSMKVLSWAHLNFELQFLLSKGKEKLSKKTHKQLQEVGYEGKSIQDLEEKEYKKLFEKESFFSSSQTGKRIAAFALQINGLNQDQFKEIEESISNAYNDIKEPHQENKLLEQSYQHTLDTLCVFKL
ncbi:MAG: hypothetical protein COA44_13505 [Arcobacter sp.]|nr:MAG: hypothetical protein COA44_13505 [Arcobacter sp.]